MKRPRARRSKGRVTTAPGNWVAGRSAVVAAQVIKVSAVPQKDRPIAGSQKADKRIWLLFIIRQTIAPMSRIRALKPRASAQENGMKSPPGAADPMRPSAASVWKASISPEARNASPSTGAAWSPELRKWLKASTATTKAMITLLHSISACTRAPRTVCRAMPVALSAVSVSGGTDPESSETPASISNAGRMLRPITRPTGCHPSQVIAGVFIMPN